MRNFLDLDLLALLGFSILAFVDWINPTVKVTVAIVSITIAIFKIMDYLKKWKLQKEEDERKKAKHEVEMKILQKQLDK